MLYPTLNQPYVFIFIMLAGLISGFFFDIANFLNIFFNRNKITKQFLYFFATITSVLILILTNLITNYGIFRIFILLTFLIAFTIQRFTLGSLITKVIDKSTNIKIPKLKFHKLKTASKGAVKEKKIKKDAKQPHQE